MKKEYVYKVSLFGEAEVGKSTLVKRYLTGYFEEDIKITMGAGLFIKPIDFNGFRVILQIWDFGGEAEFQFLLPIYSSGSALGLLMFDLTQLKTLDTAQEWVNAFYHDTPMEENRVPILLVGGKSDLLDEKNIPREEIKVFQQNLQFKEYIETSSKTGENVGKLFQRVVETILKSQSDL